MINDGVVFLSFFLNTENKNKYYINNVKRERNFSKTSSFRKGKSTLTT